MKILHAADIHLDSPMHGLAAYDTAPVRELRLATRVALANLVDLALAEQVDALLVAGDLYDGDWHDYATGAQWIREAQRLREGGVRVVVVTGNHDASSRITRALRLPDNVEVLPVDHAGTVVLEDAGVAVHGRGYATQAVLEDLSVGYPDPLPGLVNIGLLHTSADGRPGHERYAPCRIDRLAAHGYDLWALGHVHQREVLHADPPILFAGCLQGRHAREGGPKGATLITADGGGLRLEEHILDHVRWNVCEVETSGCSDVDEVLAAVAAGVRDSVAAADGRLLALRVRLTGATTAHRALVREGERVAWEVRSLAAEAAGDGAWLEKVQLRTRESGSSGDVDDAHAELVRALRAPAGDDAALAELGEELRALRDKLPAPLLAEWDPTAPEVVRGLLEDLEHALPARLSAEATA
jgi:DNA repair exonuclease SbcCD nuclease subunit